MSRIRYPIHSLQFALLTGILLAAPAIHAEEVVNTKAPWRNALYLPKEPTVVLDAFALAILEATNSVRSTALPTPSPALPPMVWDANAARVAQDWADNCEWGHNGNRSDEYAALTGEATYVGENVAADSYPMTPTERANSTVGRWAAEATDYDYVNNSCSDTCGHYTQLVWRSSSALGCAIASCPTILGGGPGHFVVCNYVPGGNYTGQLPY